MRGVVVARSIFPSRLRRAQGVPHGRLNGDEIEVQPIRAVAGSTHLVGALNMQYVIYDHIKNVFQLATAGECQVIIIKI